MKRIIMIALLLVLPSISIGAESDLSEKNISIPNVPELPDSGTYIAHASYLSTVYMQSLPNKPEDNIEYLRLWIIAFKNFEQAIEETEKDEDGINLILPKEYDKQ